MVTGVGTDLLKISRLSPETLREDDPFFKSTYTARESAQARERDDPRMYCATRFAGKEAVFKALGIPADGVRLNEIEILAAPDGHPVVTLHGKVRAMADARGICQILLSLSYDTEYAVAYAIAQDNDAVPREQ